MNAKIITILTVALSQLSAASATELDLEIKRALDSRFGEDGFKNKLDACDMSSAYANHLLGENTSVATNHRYIPAKDKMVEYLNLKAAHYYPEGYTAEAGNKDLNKPLTVKIKYYFQAEFRASLDDLSKGGSGARVDNILNPCIKAYSAFFTAMGSDLIGNTSTLKPANKIKSDSSSHKKCLEAKDYEGCMRVQSGQPTSPRKQIQDNCMPNKWCTASAGIDALGRQKIEGWSMIYRPSKRSVLYRRPSAQKVNVRGRTDRYFQIEMLLRHVVDPVSGIAPSSTSIGSSRTNCTAGVGYTVNCTTTPPLTINTPGRAASPGGITDSSSIYVYDCKERTVGFHVNGQLRGKWARANSNDNRNLNKYCPIINSLETSMFDKYSNN